MVSIASRSRRSASTVFLGEALLFGDIDRNADQVAGRYRLRPG